ncbi:hypothetical protein M0K80_RS19990 [Providencia rettgeri]|nr:hypothetical protein [Providencia rettgeri]
MSKKNRTSLNQIQRCYELDEMTVNRELAKASYGPAALIFFLLIFFLPLKAEFNLWLSLFLSLLAGYIAYRVFGRKIASNKIEYLDQLLLKYTPMNQEAYEKLKKSLNEEPDGFYTYLGEFINKEREFCDKKHCSKSDEHKFKFIK